MTQEKNLQIIITTHNPEFLSGLEPELDKAVRLYNFSKDSSGATQIKKIVNDEEWAQAVMDLSSPDVEDSSS